MSTDTTTTQIPIAVYGTLRVGYRNHRFLVGRTAEITRGVVDGYELVVEEAQPKLKRPPLYRVILLNDDYTPMEFVVEVLQSIFGMERPKATRVMLEVHTKGKGICGVYDYQIAETKVAQVMGIAQQQQHPLLCTMEES